MKQSLKSRPTNSQLSHLPLRRVLRALVHPGSLVPSHPETAAVEELGGKFQGGITNLTKTSGKGLLAEGFITSSREVGCKSIWRSTAFDATPSIVSPSIVPIAAYLKIICWYTNLQPGKLRKQKINVVTVIFIFPIWNSWSQKNRAPSESTAAIATWQKSRPEESKAT